MKYLAFCFIWLLCQHSVHSQSGFVIDHDDVDLFDHIPENFLDSARNTRMLFSDRSVGQNVHEALDFLAYPSWAQTPASARRDYTDDQWHWKTFNQNDWNAGLVPDRIRFIPDPVRYDRSNWHFALKSGSWKELTQDFITVLGPSYADSVEVWSFQFSYLNVTETETIAEPQTGFFSNQANSPDIYDLETFLASYPNHTFVYWTTSLARGIGTSVSTSFNEQLRDWCLANDKILFDFADILSHTDQGAPCFDNRDGIPYTSQTGQMEDHPDDGYAYPAICQDYTTETEGGHLGSVSAGSIRIIKAMWVLMARIAGWDGQITAVSHPKADEQTWQLSPNPVRPGQSLTVRTNIPFWNGEVRVIDQWGRCLYRETVTQSDMETGRSLPLGSYSPGRYFLVCTSQHSSASIPFIVSE